MQEQPIINFLKHNNVLKPLNKSISTNGLGQLARNEHDVSHWRPTLPASAQEDTAVQ
jgi:hypothetical protein